MAICGQSEGGSVFGRSAESVLVEGEQVIARARKHWSVFYSAAFWCVISFAFLFMAPHLQKLAIIALLLTLILGIFAVIDFYGTQILLTDIRLLLRVGFIRKLYPFIILWEITTIRCEQPFWGKWFHFGTLTVRDKEGREILLRRIARVREFEAHLRERWAECQEYVKPGEGDTAVTAEGDEGKRRGDANQEETR